MYPSSKGAGRMAAFWNTVVATLKSSSRPSPSVVTIPRGHIDENQHGELEIPFKKDLHYFQVLINEMYLAQARQWLTSIDPVVYVVSEFTYNGKPQVVPFLVGPGLLKLKGVPDQYTQGVIIRNTNVSGLYPYRGGGLTITVLLCQAATTVKFLRSFLGVIEKTASALNFSPVLSPYTTVAEVVMDGLDSLFNSGGITPLLGLRDSYGPNYNTPFQPAYFALIDQPGVNPNGLWVRQRQLMEGASFQTAKPYRQADYVLYSFAAPQENKRDDLDTLPFRDTWERIKKDAASPKDDPDYKNAKAQMSTLYLTMVSSPDLTSTQADEEAEKYARQMKEIHERAVKFGQLGAPEPATPEEARLNRARGRAAAILDS